QMEAAYGLAINLTFIARTILMCVFLSRVHVPNGEIVIFAVFYFTIEMVFLTGNVVKLKHGGWLTLVLASSMSVVVITSCGARKIKNSFVRFADIRPYFPIIAELSEDKSVPVFATRLVYLTRANNKNEIESKIMYSILNKKPKRADVYWLVHVDVMDNPHTKEY